MNGKFWYDGEGGLEFNTDRLTESEVLELIEYFTDGYCVKCGEGIPDDGSVLCSGCFAEECSAHGISAL
jgi:hypothetical protein